MIKICNYLFFIGLFIGSGINFLVAQENDSITIKEILDNQIPNHSVVKNDSVQYYSISGVVLDSDHFPIETTLNLEPLNVKTESDEDGNFLFENIPAGFYVINAVNPYNNQNQRKGIQLNEDIDSVIISFEVEIKIDEMIPIVSPFPLINLDPLNFTAKPPFTAKNISNKEIQQRNLGQDLPILLKNTPAIVSTSDAGAGIGYTGLRIRGSDQTRINVTINGIPLNDSESHGVFWVNTPDLATSTNQIIIQRGLGTSTNGTAAFGASVNIETKEPAKKAFADIAASIGSFNTEKYSVNLGSGEFAKNLFAQGRFSYITSDGYIDRARSDLFAYNAELMYKNDKRKIWFTTFGGREETYQSWFGVDQSTLENNRRFNSAGVIRDENGNIVDFYDEQVDDYHQDHYQLHYEENFNDWLLNAAFHYTYGRGFFEEYQDVFTNQNINFTPENVQLENYRFGSGVSDLVRRQWLRNHFYGITFGLTKHSEKWNWIFGGAVNRYDGDHFGRLIAIPGQNNIPETEYYFNNGLKDEASIYTKVVGYLGDFEIFGDLQYRHINYQTSAPESGLNPELEDFRPLNESFNFINPKAGITYKSGFGDFYFSYALGHREPNRSDYFDNDQNPEAESLHDWELGYRTTDYNGFQLNTNFYFMYYVNQLVQTGEVNDVGAFIRANSGESYRTGLEVDASFRANSWLNLFGNAAYSINQNRDWSEEINGEIVNFGNTNIAFSPDFIGNIGVELIPFKGFSFNWISKYVSEQFMSNAEFRESLLDAYTITDLNLRYRLPKIRGFQYVEVNLLINNIFDSKYKNNGFYFNFFDGNTQDPRGLNHNPFFYPQAGTNILAGIRVRI